MAKRKASSKKRAGKAKAVKRERGVVVSPPPAERAASPDVPDEEQQPPAVSEPAPRGRKKRAKSQEPPPHWRVGETAEEPASATEPIAHLAKCAECAASVRFTRSASGHGIAVLERYGVDIDTTFGIDGTGVPICPNGHGAMSLADEQLPAAEAITAVAEKVNGTATPTQAQLFEMAQPFNFEGAWMDIEVKNGVVAELARVFEEDAARAKRSRKALEEAQTLLSRMIETYHERRLKKERDARTQREMAAAAEPIVIAATEPEDPTEAAVPAVDVASGSSPAPSGEPVPADDAGDSGEAVTDERAADDIDWSENGRETEAPL